MANCYSGIVTCGHMQCYWSFCVGQNLIKQNPKRTMPHNLVGKDACDSSFSHSYESSCILSLQIFINSKARPQHFKIIIHLLFQSSYTSMYVAQTTNMGVSGKWIKTLLGIKKTEKSDDNETRTLSFGKLRHRRRNSVEINNNIFRAGLVEGGHSNADPYITNLPSTSNKMQDPSQTREEWAAIRIQTAFRGILARRALRALKGLVRLQALVRGHAVRKQAALTLRCMQALVRVQARVKARRVCLSLDQSSHQQQLQNEAHVQETEVGWCDSVGSVEEIQAKLIKRQEAAAKRERAMAYALAHQWQARSRQQTTQSGFEPDKSNWGWNWLERWMAVRPWENRSLDINRRDEIKIQEKGYAKQEQLHHIKNPLFVTSNRQSEFPMEKIGQSQFDGVDSFPVKSTSMLESPDMVCVNPKSNSFVDSVNEPSLRPRVGSRLHSNQGKKQSSLPSSGKTGQGLGGQMAGQHGKSAARTLSI
ncbi:putative IQ motif, EF-hand binding protein [Helianthus annuus]|uniref:IQ motif, EF-hand binding protein n=2 Tax=Helianthus annuus TaxID=4232 RepID=A0A251VC56_HELAN|nr:putative IQ motif, EF-hand binding protein [Helianthus annuus]KAJ0594727.1 putative IQ motif, EF-hand binding protein [Helianthus annuus]